MRLSLVRLLISRSAISLVRSTDALFFSMLEQVPQRKKEMHGVVRVGNTKWFATKNVKPHPKSVTPLSMKGMWLATLISRAASTCVCGV